MLSVRERGIDDDGLPNEISVNLAEYMYFRRAALSWKDCVSNNDYIQKVEVKGCAFVIMLPFTPINDNDLNMVWLAGQDLLPRSDVPESGRISFIGFTSLFRKYDSFKKYDYNLLRDGTLSYKTMMKGLDDGRLPIERLNKKNVDKLFNHYTDDKYKENYNYTKEAVGLDFKAYFVLGSITDAVDMYGKASPGTVNEGEFLLMLESRWVPHGVLPVID